MGFQDESKRLGHDPPRLTAPGSPIRVVPRKPPPLPAQVPPRTPRARPSGPAPCRPPAAASGLPAAADTRPLVGWGSSEWPERRRARRDWPQIGRAPRGGRGRSSDRFTAPCRSAVSVEVVPGGDGLGWARSGAGGGAGIGVVPGWRRCRDGGGNGMERVWGQPSLSSAVAGMSGSRLRTLQGHLRSPEVRAGLDSHLPLPRGCGGR